MNKTRHLDTALKIFRGPEAPAQQDDKRARYCAGLLVLGYATVPPAEGDSHSYAYFRSKSGAFLLRVGIGDDLSVRTASGQWRRLPLKARRNIVLQGQASEL